MKHYPSQKGFTLVELSIVLVIIGLIVSSVLVGQDLIRSAELRATIAQYREISTAVTTFRGKYPGIPGDIDNGARFGLGNASTTATFQDGSAGAGDGNGMITQDNALTVLAATGEMATFWAHLTTPGLELIPGLFDGDGGGTVAGVDMPALKFGNNAGWGVYGTGRNANFLVAGLASDGTNVTNTVNVFLPLDAFNIDEKVDDGVPTSGDVQSRGAHATDIDNAATTNAGVSATVCNNTTPTPDEYQFTATTAQCTLRFALTTP